MYNFTSTRENGYPHYGHVHKNLNGFYSLNTGIGWIEYFALIVK